MPLGGILIAQLYGDNNLDNWEEIRDIGREKIKHNRDFLLINEDFLNTILTLFIQK